MWLEKVCSLPSHARLLPMPQHPTGSSVRALSSRVPSLEPSHRRTRSKSHGLRVVPSGSLPARTPLAANKRPRVRARAQDEEAGAVRAGPHRGRILVQGEGGGRRRCKREKAALQAPRDLLAASWSRRRGVRCAGRRRPQARMARRRHARRPHAPRRAWPRDEGAGAGEERACLRAALWRPAARLRPRAGAGVGAKYVLSRRVQCAYHPRRFKKVPRQILFDHNRSFAPLHCPFF